MSKSKHREIFEDGPPAPKVKHERHQILPVELAAEPEVEELTWDSVKDSIEFVKHAWETLHGYPLADSDVYSIMYTQHHRNLFEKFKAL